MIMKRLYYRVFTFLFAVGFMYGCSPVEIVSGDENLSYLDEKKIALKFDYSKTTVGGDEQSEEAFIKEKVREKNQDESGEGDQWKKKWNNNKENVYHPAFENQFNEYLIECGYEVADDPSNAKYIAILEVRMIEPGFYGGVVHKNAEVETRMKVVKNGNEDSPKTVMKDDHGVSQGEHMTTKQRLQSAYKVSSMKYGRHFRDVLCD